MAFQVFICHSSRDKAAADAACVALEGCGVGCWIAPRDVLPGLEYGEALIEAISGCQILVLIFSGHANDSPQVRREIERAVSKRKPIVPFRVENVLPVRAMEFALSNTQWLDALNGPVEQYLPGLCQAVLALAERASRSEPGSLAAPDPSPRKTEITRVGGVPVSVVAADQHPRRKWRPQAKAAAAIFLGACALAVAAIGILEWFAPSKTTSALESTPITSSADSKSGPLFTDGTRLYFNSRGEPAEMAVSGGIIAPAHIFGLTFNLLDVSADGSKALALTEVMNDESMRGTLWTESTLGGTPRQGSSHLAKIARWAPDGRSIVFADQKKLYRIDEDGGNLTPIWEAPGDIRDFSFTPDGRQLSVSVNKGAMGRPRLWLLDAAGKNAHPLEFGWSPDLDHTSGQWTPNGNHFVFLSNREGINNVYELVIPSWFEFWKKPTAIRITGNQLNILGMAPSRDSQSLFVIGRPDQGALQALDPGTGRFVPYLDGMNAQTVVVSPDRQWLAYVEYPSLTLWKCRLDGSERLQLTKGRADMQRWSPDGKELVYSDWLNLYLVSADGGAPEKIVSDTEDNEHLAVMPTWSRDGKTISWNYFPFPNSPMSGIHVLDLASRQRSVMPGSKGYYVAAWSPDGKFMAAIAQNPSRMVLYSTATRTWKDLKKFDLRWGYWEWSSDSKWIYMVVHTPSPGIYRLTVADGEWKRMSGLEGLVDLPEFARFSLTPDDRPALMSSTGVAQIYSLHWKAGR
jgi:hypothetical protein